MVAKNLEHYAKEIYVVVLGLGFAYFIGSFISDLSGDVRPVNLAMRLVYFCSLYYFFTYDWIAYNSLVRNFPYSITVSLRSLGRFYTDLFALLVKACLLFLAAQVVDYLNTLLIAILFVCWHATILVWYYFARSDYANMPRLWPTHVRMMIVYFVFTLLLLLSAQYFPQSQTARGVQVSLAILCAIIVAHAAWRTKYLLKKLAAIQ